MTCLFLRLYNIKISPKVVIQTKNVTLKGALFLQIRFQGKGKPMETKHMIERSDLDRPPFGGDPTNSILTTSS
jgi:hypothetical protein